VVEAGVGAVAEAVAVVEAPAPGTMAARQAAMTEQAAALRREAVEMEVSLREEARAKGVCVCMYV
jgi:hypothetical protein